MEERFQRGKERILNKLEFPHDISLDLPKIIVIGNREIIIENHKGIIFFETNIVKINSRIGAIVIKGEAFEILFIAETSITISGNFQGISYER
jgi:sporulation protein YqfC